MIASIAQYERVKRGGEGETSSGNWVARLGEIR